MNGALHKGPCVRAKSLQLCPTLCDPMDHSPPGSSVHGILQARILAWIAMFTSRGFFTTSATWEAPIEGRRVLFIVRFQLLLKDSEEALQGKGDLFWVRCSFCSRISKNLGGASGKEPACQCRRCKTCGFNPWLGKIPWRREQATHSSILAWRIPINRGPWRVTVHRVPKSRRTEAT